MAGQGSLLMTDGRLVELFLRLVVLALHDPRSV